VVAGDSPAECFRPISGHDNVSIGEAGTGKTELFAILRPGVCQDLGGFGIEVGQLHRRSTLQRLDIEVTHVPARIE
jgi:hypothetical protein